MIRGASARPLWIAASGLLLLVGAGGEALAHAKLVSSSPAANQTVTPPTSLTLKFSESIEVRFAQVTLSDASGTAVKTGAVTQDPGDRAILIVPLAAPLAGGQYTVSWQIVAADGHKTKGTYHFISEK